MVRRLAVAVIAIFVVLAYLYGPAASPAMRTEAIAAVQRPRRGQLAQLPADLERRCLPALDVLGREPPGGERLSLGWWTNPFDS